jgi:hypothetical protein
MIYGFDLLDSEIRWVRLSKVASEFSYGVLPLSDGSSLAVKHVLKAFFNREKTHRFVFALQGRSIRVKSFASDKVDISELEDNVAWEARFFLEYEKSRDVLSFDPLRSVGQETWIVAAVAPLAEVRRQSEVFPVPPLHVETALTAIANGILESKWNQNSVLLLHLDYTRAFLVIVSHGNPILMQEIEPASPFSGTFDEKTLSFWQEELKLRRNFLLPDHRKLDKLLLSGVAALEGGNAKRLGERLDLEGEVFNPFEGLGEPVGSSQGAPLFTVAFSCAMRSET